MFRRRRGEKHRHSFIRRAQVSYPIPAPEYEDDGGAPAFSGGETAPLRSSLVLLFATSEDCCWSEINLGAGVNDKYSMLCDCE